MSIYCYYYLLYRPLVCICVFVCVYVCVCVFDLHPLLFPAIGRRTCTLRSGCKIDKANFEVWMSFIPCNFLEEISPHQ